LNLLYQLLPEIVIDEEAASPMHSIREFIFSSLLTFDSFGLLSDHCKRTYKLQAEQYINSNGIFLKL